MWAFHVGAKIGLIRLKNCLEYQLIQVQNSILGIAEKVNNVNSQITNIENIFNYQQQSWSQQVSQAGMFGNIFGSIATAQAQQASIFAQQQKNILKMQLEMQKKYLAAQESQLTQKAEYMKSKIKAYDEQIKSHEKMEDSGRSVFSFG